MFLIACNPKAVVVRTEIVDAPVRQWVRLPAELTADCPKPAKPAPECVTGGKPVLCNRQLVDWREAYDAALDDCNARLERVRSIQKEVNAR